MENNSFIMVSGAAASGKSTLVHSINNELNGCIFKPSNAYLALAREKGISMERAFFEISDIEAEDYFCKVCMENHLVVGDQHLAIQHYKDSLIASNSFCNEFPDEPYVSALNYKIFSKMAEYNTETLVIFLKASPQALFERAYNRFLTNGTYMRNKSIEEVAEEIKAETYFFNQLIENTNLPNFIIDTDGKKSDEVLDYALQRIRKFKG